MREEFKDRRETLFGRERDVHWLVDRAHEAGLSVLFGRPLMGKTWTLVEVARRLLEEGRFLVGYHESKGDESSQLLHAVSDLYARWLEDSSMREQAVSLWKRHKHELVPRVGQMIGLVFDKIAAKQLPGGVASLVRAAFDGLAEAQKDLLSGGLELSPLKYDQAYSLTKLVADVSGRRIVLILDAWEKSPSFRLESATLDAYLKHLEDWPNIHILLAIRSPDLDTSRSAGEAYSSARNLCRSNSAAQLYELKQMSVADRKEKERILRYVRETVPAAKALFDDGLLNMISGYPGVLDFWTSRTNRTAMNSATDLGKVAADAHAVRYVDLEGILAGLQDRAISAMAARLAFFSRLDADKWTTIRSAMLKDQSEAEIEALVDNQVLQDERFPTYGHDTRHATARKWFIENRPSLIRRVSEQLVGEIATRITGLETSDLPYVEALAGCAESAADVGLAPMHRCLVCVAKGLVYGMGFCEGREFDDGYRETVRSFPSVTPLIAASLGNRAIVKDSVLNREGAIADLTALIELSGITATQRMRALGHRGFLRFNHGDLDGAIADFSMVIQSPDVLTDQMTGALFYRGVARRERVDYEGAVADFTEIIEKYDVSAQITAFSVFCRGEAERSRGNLDEAIADYTAVIGLPDAPENLVEDARRKLSELKT